MRIPSGAVIFASKNRPLTVTVDKPPTSVGLNDKKAIRYWEEQRDKVAMQKGLHFSKVNERRTEVNSKPAIEFIYLVTHSSYPLELAKEKFILIAKGKKTTYALNFFAPSFSFDEANKTYFEPMIQSFKFKKHDMEEVKEGSLPILKRGTSG
jgi:hypothetical protein